MCFASMPMSCCIVTSLVLDWDHVFCLDAHVVLHLGQFRLKVLDCRQGHMERLVSCLNNRTVFEVAVAFLFSEGDHFNAFLLHHLYELLICNLFCLLLAEHHGVGPVAANACNNGHGYHPPVGVFAALRATHFLEGFVNLVSGFLELVFYLLLLWLLFFLFLGNLRIFAFLLRFFLRFIFLFVFFWMLNSPVSFLEEFFESLGQLTSSTFVLLIVWL